MIDTALADKLNDNGGACPECGGRQWWRGPQGGLAVNVACAKCGFALSVTKIAAAIDRVVFAQVIDRAAFVRVRTFGRENEPVSLMEAATPRSGRPASETWSCGHVAGAICAECYGLLAKRAHELAEENLRLRSRIALLEEVRDNQGDFR